MALILIVFGHPSQPEFQTDPLPAAVVLVGTSTGFFEFQTFSHPIAGIA
ncbi:hypothetical protein NKJ84_20950 [Mesorhizobium sp. M0048]